MATSFGSPSRYWGKARPVADGPACHLLVWHSLDVAAVAAVYLRRSPRLTRWWRQELGLADDDQLIGWVCFWMSIHDLGKFSLTFQAQCADLVAQLQDGRRVQPSADAVRHDTLGRWAWDAWVRDEAIDAGWFGAADDVDLGLACWVDAVMGHHGQPPTVAARDLGRHFQPPDIDAVRTHVRDMAALFLSPGMADAIGQLDGETFERRSRQLSWWVAGLAVLCDWIGSNATIFAYDDRADRSRSDHWDLARQRAVVALDAAGVIAVPLRGEQTLHSLFPQIHRPSPLQQAMAELPIDARPQIHLLEDITGAGKTEAAMLLVYRLMQQGLADGFYIALPTMATANAMYGRLACMYQLLFEGAANLVLAQGRRDLVEAFALSVVDAGLEEADPRQDGDSATSRCSRWLADHNKRALLSQAGVGTIDQVLLGVLQSRHQSLRLLGLHRKVLVVDEVHACDAYMQGALESLLDFHASAGGSAVLLSATLPLVTKRKLLAAYARGRGRAAPDLPAAGFPLVTSWTDPGGPGMNEPVRLLRVDGPARVSRHVKVRYEADLSKVVDHIVDRLRCGDCVAWIRNTVADVLAARALLATRVTDDQVTIFHARMALGDRLDVEGRVLDVFGPHSGASTRSGRLLLATQVAEQSLDVDLDHLVSDLAPIDRLIQRAGRLRRHARDPSGNRLPPDKADQRGVPELWVHGPAWTDEPAADWFKSVLAKAAHVYDDHAILWHTARELVTRGGYRMPDDARALVEGVYGEEVDMPDGLAASHSTATGRGYSERSAAQMHGVKRKTGYQRAGLDWMNDGAATSRLGEATVPVVLATWRDGMVRPWRDDKARHAWAYSTVSMARRLIFEADAPTDDARKTATDAARAAMPGGGAWQVLLVLDQVDGIWQARACGRDAQDRPTRSRLWRYDAQLGLLSEPTPAVG